MAETAIMLPIFLTILLSGIEVGRFALLQQKLSRTAVAMSDLIAMTKTTLNLTQIDNLYDAASRVMAPFDLAQNGVVIVSAVTKGDGTPPNINWQCIGGGALVQSSELGTAGGLATFPGTFTLTDGEIVIVAEAAFSYQPFIAPDLIGPTIIRQRAMFRPRTGTLSALLDGPVTAGAPTCLPTPPP